MHLSILNYKGTLKLIAMDIFYIDLKAKETGEYEMHRSGCKFLPDQTKRYYVGLFGTCNEALKEAKKSFPKSNGCPFCCKACHTATVKKVSQKVEVG